MASQILWGEVEVEERGWQGVLEEEEVETMPEAEVEVKSAPSPLEHLEELVAVPGMKSDLDQKPRTLEELEDQKPRTIEELEDQCKLLLDKFSQSSSDFTRSPPQTQHWQPRWPS